MKIHHLRNATFVIECGENHFLVDPMLGKKGSLPPFSFIRHEISRNPTVPLPENASGFLGEITHCLVTHSHTFGLKALQHTDHIDPDGELFLKKHDLPVIRCKKDCAYLKKHGLNVIQGLDYWQQENFMNGEIMAIPARHGQGWIHHLMSNGAGFYLRLPGEPSIYISGDTVLTDHVERALTELKPDIAVVAAGGARMDVGGPILMPLEEVVGFARLAPGKVIANHLEALNHCATTRSQLKEALKNHGLLSKTFIPEDGETIIVDPE